MARLYLAVFGIVLLAPLLTINAHAIETKGKLALIIAEDEALLRHFDEKVDTTKLSYLKLGGERLTLAESVADKVDVVIAKVEEVLEMRPKLYGLIVAILPDHKAVQQAFLKVQGVPTDYLAFYAPREDTIYISITDVNLKILAHEVAHAIIYHYFRVGPTEKIHEVLAQYAESQMP